MIAKEHQWTKGLPILGGIWAIGAVFDRLWFAIDQSVPAWEQAEHLTTAMTYWRTLQQPQWFSSDWWTEFWALSPKVPPLVYISTAPFIGLFGAGEDASTLVNLLYSLVLLGAVYGLGVRLFNVQVGLWAAGLCLVLPGLSLIRLEYSIKYPFVAIVTSAFFCLTLWMTQQKLGLTKDQVISTSNPIALVTQSLAILPPLALPRMPSSVRTSWIYSAAFGVLIGFALLIHPSALVFIIVPIVWLCISAIQHRTWQPFIQLVLSVAIALLVGSPWYRTNAIFLFINKEPRSTSFSGLELPALASVPLFVVGLVGLVLYWKRAVVHQHWAKINGRWIKTIDYGGLRKKGFRQEVYQAWWQSIRWILGFLIGGLILCAITQSRITPLLPVLAILLAQGLVLFPDRLRIFRWGAVGLAAILTLVNLLPLQNSPKSLLGKYQHHTVVSENWHQPDVIKTVIETEPYLQTTIGVTPSQAELNAQSFNYFGVLRNFQVYGAQVEQNGQEVPWLVAQGALNNPDFRLYQTWLLPDRSKLNLYRQRVAPIKAEPVKQEPGRVKLEQIRIPNRVAPGKPMPMTYRWSGSWEQLRSGLVLLSWTRIATNGADKSRNVWYHDHAIALNRLHAPASEDQAQFQVTERIAALPPADAQGTYALKATYLNRDTGETYDIPVPEINLRVSSKAESIPAFSVDFVTQLRSLSATLPEGLSALDRVLEGVGRLDRADPTRSYLTDARQILEYRLQKDPENLEFAYGLALVNGLARRIGDAIAVLNRVVRLDARNPTAYAYLALANLSDFRPQTAQTAINSALALNPDLPELHRLNGIAGLMQGHLIQAWQESQKAK